MRRSAAWVTAGVLGVLACADEAHVPADDATSTESWGQEAEDWAFAMQGLLTAQGGVGILPFLADEATFDARTIQHSAQFRRGVDEIVQWFVQGFPIAPGFRGVELWRIDPPVFIDATGMAMWGTYQADPLTSIEPVPASEVLLMVDVAPEGVVHLHILSAVATWRGAPLPRPLAVVDRAESLAERWASTWSAGDPLAPVSMYASAASIEDAIAGVSIRGAAAIGDRREVTPSVSWQIERRSESPAVYHFSPEWSRRIDRLDGVAFVVRGDDGAACPGRQAVWLELDVDGLITSERRYWSVDDAQRCRDDPSDGWWTRRPVPAPATGASFEDLSTVTGTVTVGDASTEIRNGTGTLSSLVAWAGSRFERAGMAWPEVDSVTFTQFTDYCEVARGRSIPRTVPGRADVVGWDVVLCIDDADVCRQPECTSFLAGPSFAVLHEFAHVWMDRHLTDEVRRAFTVKVGLEVWDDRSMPWDQRAVEWAASIIAWGLLDSGYYLMELGNPPSELRIAGFQLLTARQPLQPVEE